MTTIRTRVRRSRQDQRQADDASEYGDVVGEILAPVDDRRSEAERFADELDADPENVFPADLSTDPAVRLRYINEVYGTQAAKEYAFRTMIKLAMRGSRVETIAQVFSISLQTAYRWRQELHRRMADEAATLSMNSLITESLLTYKEISQMAFSELSQQGQNGQPALRPVDRARYMALIVMARRAVDTMVVNLGVAAQKKYQPDESGDARVDSATSIEAVVRAAMKGSYDPNLLEFGANDRDMAISMLS